MVGVAERDKAPKTGKILRFGRNRLFAVFLIAFEGGVNSQWIKMFHMEHFTSFWQRRIQKYF